MNYSGNDIYCDVILQGKVPLKKEIEGENVLAYHHTQPRWPVHIVVVPKKHIASFLTLSREDTPILFEIIDVVRSIAVKVEKEYGGARILTNVGTYQDSKHLHIHISSDELIEKS